MRNHASSVPGWKLLLALGLPLLLGVGAVAGAYLYSSAAVKTQPVQAAAAPANVDVPAPAGLLVHVLGAVEHPGLYRMKRGDRVYDAIAAAGGLSPDADLSKLPNLAGRLSDGKQVKVARLKASTSRSGAPAKVDINSADAATLASVPGVDPALAQAIVDYRNGYGPFASVTELKTALGLDASTLGAIRRYLTAY